MTELGMALTNPLEPKARRPGFVGVPFPSVECRIVKEGEKGLHTFPISREDKHSGCYSVWNI